MADTNTNMQNEEEEADTGDEVTRKDRRFKKLLNFCKQGLIGPNDKDKLENLLKDELCDVLQIDDNKWTGLQWAVVSNHPEIVKILYPKVKEKEEQKRIEEERKEKEANSNARKLNDLDENFKKPDNPAKKGEYTALHWSAYKGYDVISSILIHQGCDPLKVDRTGNNALHQAASSNKMSTFKMFMGLGIDLELKNARSHTPIDLCMNKQIIDLIKKCLATRECEICHKHFDFFNKRYICSINEETVCKDCCKIGYYYEKEDSPEQDVFDCRCNNCFQKIVDVENSLREAIKSNILEKVSQEFEKSKSYKICEHLKKEAKETEDRLRREKQIKEHLDSLKVVENHKTILKSVDILEKMVIDADAHGVNLDPTIIQRAKQEKDRLLAEKELRTVLDNLTVEMSSDENLLKLTDKVNKAKANNVEATYVNVGEDLVSKITKNLAAKSLLQYFLEYPIREYPVVEEVDPKKKKTAAPAPKKKKKKKEPPFIVPDWAQDLNVLVEKVTEFNGYLSEYKQIGLNDDFQKSGKEQYNRFWKKEIPFRKNEEEEKRRIEEEKAAKKKKKK